MRFLCAAFLIATVAFGTDNIVLTEELRFGGAEAKDDHFEWLGANKPCAFDIDQRGHYYVIDARNARIMEFDAQGNFVRQLASQGQGPGEYQSVGHFQIMKDGSAVGLDNLQGTMRRQNYNTDLEFQDAELMTGLVGFTPRVRFSPSGKYAYAWFLKFNTEDQSLVSLSAITDGDLKPIETFFQTPWPSINGNTLSNRNLLVQGLAMQFKGIWHLNARIAKYLSDDRLLFVNNETGTIEIKSPDNREVLMTVKHTIKREPFESEQREALVDALEEHLFNQGGQALMNIVTPQVMAESIEKADLPRLSYPVQDIIPVSDGGFIIVTKVDYGRKSVAIQLFDQGGHFRGQANFPGQGVWTIFETRLHATGAHIYAMETNADGDNQMVRYAYQVHKDAI